MKWWIPVIMVALAAAPTTGAASDLLTLDNTPPSQPIEAAETKLAEFSPLLAANYLDIASLNWQKQQNCVTCHTNMAYLMARPALEEVSKTSGEVRNLFKEYITDRWNADTGTPPKLGDYRTVVVATGLVFHDVQTTGTLSDVTLQALDLMWATQRDDGGWTWAKCGWAPMEIDDHYGVTLAVLTAGIASSTHPENKSSDRGIKRALEYLGSNPKPSLHHRVMLGWASRYTEGILTHKQQMAIVQEVLDTQLPDGGWSTGKMLSDWKEFKRKDQKPQVLTASDGYATGLALILLAEFGFASDEPLIKNAIAWIKQNQDSDGKWFCPSPSKDSKQFFTNIGTAFSVLGLQAHGQLPGWPFPPR